MKISEIIDKYKSNNYKKIRVRSKTFNIVFNIVKTTIPQLDKLEFNSYAYILYDNGTMDNDEIFDKLNDLIYEDKDDFVEIITDTDLKIIIP